MTTSEEMTHRLVNHPPVNEAVSELLESVTNEMVEMAAFILVNVPEGREQSLALTKLEEMSMWIKAGIARNQ